MTENVVKTNNVLYGIPSMSCINKECHNISTIYFVLVHLILSMYIMLQNVTREIERFHNSLAHVTKTGFWWLCLKIRGLKEPSRLFCIHVPVKI